MAQPRDWSTQQLGEFLAAVSAFTDEKALHEGAVQLAAEALDAELAAVVEDGRVVASVGFPRDNVPAAVLVRAASENLPTIDVAGLGRVSSLVAPLGDSPPGYLLLGRTDAAGFDRSEANLVRTMARSVTLAARMLRLVSEERQLREISEQQSSDNARLLAELTERQRLLERLGDLRRSISLRAPLHEVQEAIVDGARELLGDEVVGLRLIDPDDRNYLLMVAHRGVTPDILPGQLRAPIGHGVGSQAIEEDRLVVVESYSDSPLGLDPFASHGLAAAMAAPVREEGRVVGSLVVATFRKGRRYTQTDRELLVALTEMANIALTEASMLASMRHQAFHDSLTGLANRALFIDRMEMALARSRRHPDAAVALLFLDIDNFKSLNDTLGHAVGDAVLAVVGERLMDAQRETDTAARLGGDEFAILLEDIRGQDEATAIAERVSTSLTRPIEVAGREVQVTTSIGLAVATGPKDDAHSLLRNADLAMYNVKQSEVKSGWTLFEDHMYTSFLARRDMEADLRRAVEHGEFMIHYQPIIHLPTGRLHGVEALVRWEHPTRGIVPPDEFISVAEETDLIVPIGWWVLQESVRQAKRWAAAYPDHDRVGIHVNLSGRQMREPALAAQIGAFLKAERFGPEHLTLEITETVLMQDTEGTISNLGGLRDIGIRLAIDDFGTGYSSLGYLQRFKVDALKIDRSFVHGISREADKSAVARTIINLGQVLSLSTVAEGIETAAQLALLRELGCEFGQGFLFARPGPADAIERMIRKGLGGTHDGSRPRKRSRPRAPQDRRG